jgi:neutral trehalase
VSKRDFPKIHFYDQDFVDLYDKTWAWISDCWGAAGDKNTMPGKFFSYPGSKYISQADAVYSSFFLVYSNRIFHASPTLDIFYERQEPSGAIRGAYSMETGKAEESENNPEGMAMPLFAWAEYNLYHKSANKKRVKDMLPILDKWINWIDTVFKRGNGLYQAPLAATSLPSLLRRQAVYPVDFNAAMAINALYMSALADIMNEREMSFIYKRKYFSLKTRINSQMWDNESGFYYDLDEDENQIRVKTLAGYWPLLAEIPNDDKAERAIAKLLDPEVFGSPHPFPCIGINEPGFNENGGGWNGSVFPQLNFMVIKGLEKYQRWDIARESAIRHIYFLLDSMPAETSKRNRAQLWEAYKPMSEGHAEPPASGSAEAHFCLSPHFPRPQYLNYAALSTINMSIENVIGLEISLPKKTVKWTIPNLEVMGIENLSLKKNMITILSQKSGRGWEIHMESEKLYYFMINILGQKKKTLPIPSGKCSMLIDKL